MALFAEYIDATLGMGYGTSLTPILLILGFQPLQVVPAVLLSQLFSGILAGVLHHKAGNVIFTVKSMKPRYIMKKIKENGIINSLKKGLSAHLKVVVIIAACSIAGTIASVFIALNLPKFYLELYIGVLVFIIGFVILLTLNKSYVFSWRKIITLSIIASFNKGMSGGGYGPIVTGGQLLAGVDDKSAIGITSLAEGLTCLVGVLVYLLAQNSIDWSLAPYLCIGAIISVPFSVLTVKQMKTKKLRVFIGIATLILGIITLIKIFL
ncbi:MAG: sulfite exporter TauE/SafE family protein [Spirochaetales bacterium]|nr:sulfite exporter TauE/SafE family protein [Spirochaetales bacterium]